MISKIWLLFLGSSIICALVLFVTGLQPLALAALTQSLFDSCKLSVEMILGLLGGMAFWFGILRIFEQSGGTAILARYLTPFLRPLFPDLKAGHPAYGHISMNFAANMMGLDNAATPFGLRAMQSLQKDAKDKTKATDASVMFMVMNTASVTLLPIAVLVQRSALGAPSPADVFLPILLTAFVGTLCGLLALRCFQKFELFHPRLLALVGVYGLLLVALLMVKQNITDLSNKVSQLSIMALLLVIIWGAWRKKIDALQSFVQGAREGVKLTIRIFPYLLAMITAIGFLRASGILGSIEMLLSYLLVHLSVPEQVVQAIPVGMMKSFSGSGARALWIDLMQHTGVDSLPSRIAALMQGSSETTFYVLTIYFGSVGITKIRHSLWCALVADAASMVSAIFFGLLFFA